jgi:hypothetical protein
MWFSIVIAVLLLAGLSQASTLHVCPGGCNYSSIQDAIDAASPGDSIEVKSGFYNEQVMINKDVTLRGIDTGDGFPNIYIIYLCNHSNSVLSNIRSIILLGGWPEKGIFINNTVRIETVKSHNTEIIKPSLDFKGDPLYTVELQANKSAVNSGDYFGLSLFISGAGNTNSSKLRVSIPPYLVQNEIVKLTETNYSDERGTITNNRIYINPHYSYRIINNTLFAIGSVLSNFLVDL